MQTHLASFTAKGKFYAHLIDTVTDETFIVDEENVTLDGWGERIYRVDSNANVWNAANIDIGRFIVGPQRPGLWGYIDKKGLQIWSKHSIDEAEGLLAAEREVFKQLLEAA